jgi:hypothetical protein
MQGAHTDLSKVSTTFLIKGEGCQAPVAHAYNPSYLGGRDQEDPGSKPGWANSSQNPLLKKKNHHKKGLVEWFKL